MAADVPAQTRICMQERHFGAIILRCRLLLMEGQFVGAVGPFMHKCSCCLYAVTLKMCDFFLFLIQVARGILLLFHFLEKQDSIPSLHMMSPLASRLLFLGMELLGWPALALLAVSGTADGPAGAIPSASRR